MPIEPIEPQIVPTPFGPFLRGAPEGHCPWGEQKCDEDCGPYEGCKFGRERKSGVAETAISEGRQ